MANSTNYHHGDHASDVIRGLNELRMEDQFCDALLQTSDEQQFPVHKCVLVAASPYFKAMFTGNFTEAKGQPREPVVMQEATSLGLEPVLNCLYSGELKLNNDCVYDVVPIAHMLQIPGVIESCTDHLIKGLSLESCFQSLRLAEKYDICKVQKACEKFVIESFIPLSERSDFSEMSLSEVCRYLDEVNGEEVDLFRAAKRWLEFKTDRRQDTTEVMSLINFNSISAEILTSEVLGNELVTGNKECFKMVLDALNYHSNLFSQPFYEECKIRGNDVLLLYNGGVHMSQLNRRSICPDNNTPAITKELPCPCDFLARSLSMVKVGNFAFFFGLHSDTLSMGAKRFNASTGHWINLVAPPRMDVLGSTAVLVKRSIIMVGGQRAEDKNKNSLQTIYKDTQVNTGSLYSIEQNEWKRIANCPNKVVYHSVCTNHSIVYVSGGYVSKEKVIASQKLFAYDVEADLWLRKATMNVARAGSVFEAVGDELFIIGGSVFGEPVSSVEMYSIQDNQWTTVINDLPLETRGTVLFVDGDQILFIHNGKISMYDTRRKMYTDEVVPLNQGFYYGVCAILKM